MQAQAEAEAAAAKTAAEAEAAAAQVKAAAEEEAEQQRLALEAAMLTAFEVLIAKEGYGGRYVSITPDHPNFIDAAEYDELVARHIMFKDMSSDKYLQAAGIASEWPHGYVLRLLTPELVLPVHLCHVNGDALHHQDSRCLSS